MSKTFVLALDTSTPTSSVALVDRETGALGPARQAVSERHSSNLLRLCAEVMEEAGVAVPALGGIACGGGPGSFTGLRVGLAVAKGLALPADLPLVLVPSLDALALDFPAGGDGAALLPCIDGGKGQLFAAVYGREAGGAVARRGDVLSLVPAELAPVVAAAVGAGPVVFGGPGAARHQAELAGALAAAGVTARLQAVAGPTAQSVALLALPRLRRGERDDLAGAVPHYGRAPDITRPRQPPAGSR